MSKDLRLEIINGLLMFFVLFLGFFSLYLHNNILYYVYLALAGSVFIANAYFCCTRCDKYGKFCHSMAGLFAKVFFAKRENKPVEFDDKFYVSSIMLLMLFPLPFLLYYQDWMMIALYVIAATLMFWYRKRTICKKCSSEWCSFKN